MVGKKKPHFADEKAPGYRWWPCLWNAVFGEKIRFSEKNEIYVKNMLTANGKNAILSELLGTNCF